MTDATLDVLVEAVRTLAEIMEDLGPGSLHMAKLIVIKEQLEALQKARKGRD